MPSVVVSGISSGFPKLSRCEGQIAHVLLTRSPLVYSRRSLTARLACVKHAASVRPEPGSNSPLKTTEEKPSQPLINSTEASQQDTIPEGTASHKETAQQTPTNQKVHRSLPTGRFELIRRLLAHC